jgi:lipopolysaccharide export system protein LptA
LKKIILSILVFVISAITVSADELGALKIYKARLPIYHKKRLQLLIFCAEMTRQANKIYATDAVIDMLKKDVDINKIKYLEDIKPYPLGTSIDKIDEFWKDKTTTNGVIYSSKATILQDSKVASGDKKVFFRSPQLDLNGVGFTANFDKKTVKVLEDVNIIIRMKDKRNKENPDKVGIVKVNSDSMIMNMEEELITLAGNIKIDDVSFNIFCDRLYLDLKKNKNSQDSDSDSDDVINPTGVSQITCEGNVKIIRKITTEELKKGGEQKAFADKAIYNTINEQITLSGKRPQIFRGKDMISGKKIVLWKNSEKLQAYENCELKVVLPNKNKKAEISDQTIVNSDFMDFDNANNLGVFKGNVRIKNADVKLNCNQMTIHLEDRADGKKEIKSETDISNKKELKEIVCTGDVVITRDNKIAGIDEKALAGRAVYVLKDNKIILSEKKPIMIRGRDSISGEKMVVWLDQSRLEVLKDSKIIIDSKQHAVKDPGIQQTTVRSRSSDLNYGSNELSFSGKVKVENPKMDLVCENMTIFLDEDKQKVKKTPKNESSILPVDGDSNKDLKEIVCTGAVCIDESRAKLNCDRMVVNFKDKVPGTKNSNIEIGGGSKRVVDLIKCFGNVIMQNKPEDPKEKPSTASADKAIVNIAGNVADMLGNVKIEETRFKLNCEKMKMLAKDITPEQAAMNALANKNSEDMIPEHVSIGKTKELTKIICTDKVVMTRKLPDELQKATGDKAVYEVSKHNVTLTGTENKPTLQRGITVMEGEKIILWTNSEQLDIKSGTLKNFNPEAL